MACCLVFLVLFGRVRSAASALWSALTGRPRVDRRPRPVVPPIGTWSRQSMPTTPPGGVRDRRPSMARGSLAGLGTALLVEIGLALLLWNWWTHQAGRMTMGHSMMSPAPGVVALVIIAVVEAALVVAPRVLRSRVGLVGVAVASVVVVAISGALGIAASSHVVAMLEMVLMTTVVPIALVRLAGRRMPGEEGGTASSGRPGVTPWLVLAVVAAVALIATVFIWHVPSVHHEMSRGALFGRDASYLVVGGLVWTLVTGRGRELVPARTRAAILGIAYGGMGIVALAMILGPHPLMPGTDAMLPWTALADQRGGGLLMMVGDTLLVLPVIGAATADRPSRPESAPAPPHSAAHGEMELS